MCAADLCMGTCAGLDRALQESSLWGDTERERCWTGRCCSGTARVLPRSLSLELRSASTHTHTNTNSVCIHTRVHRPEKQTHTNMFPVVCTVLPTTDADRCRTSLRNVLQANDQLAHWLAGHVSCSQEPTVSAVSRLRSVSDSSIISPDDQSVLLQLKGLEMRRHWQQRLHYSTHESPTALSRVDGHLEAKDMESTRTMMEKMSIFFFYYY